jgi:sulfatase modifying factor 1
VATEDTFVTIAAGEFRMGDDAGRPNEGPAHQVWVDAFRLAITPVTRAQYQRFLDASGHTPPRFWQDPRFADPQQPAVAVSWLSATTYCQWLSSQGCHFRLPSEAEREKAARGGRQGQGFPWGNEAPTWMDIHYEGDETARPDCVGQDPANDFGLHNMADLVHEWCADWYDAGYYAQSPQRNPLGPEVGERRASRGGSWRHAIKITRCAHRSAILPDRELPDYGFRLAQNA